MVEERAERRLAAILAADVVGYSRLMGDGVLAEFASIVDAIECAVTIQRAMAERDTDLPDEKQITFRIGVNITARLEGLANPGIRI